MHRAAAETYCCPYTGQPLRFEVEEENEQEVMRGTLVTQAGLRYPVVDGFPHLIQPDRETYNDEEQREKEFYEATSDTYDAVIDWLFASFYEDEGAIRGKVIDLLDLTPTSCVLEIGAGTCRDTVWIARRLGRGARLFAQDLSPRMLAIGRERLRSADLLDGANGLANFFIGNAARLPFPDGVFDAAFHFGGLNLFSDKGTALAEMARVVRVGGKVVAGDEGVAPWHRRSDYGAILMNSSRLYTYLPPLEALPECARDAGVRWLIGNAYYVIDFRVGSGLPRINLDLPIQGQRGGTHRTRFFGNLEGVTVEAKAMARDAAKASGLSLHEWLDRAVRHQAGRTLKATRRAR